MDVLISFFTKYLLAPILAVLFLWIINNITSVKKTLNIKNLIIFVLLSTIIFLIPTLFGLLRNEFIWGGLLLTIVSYIILGSLFYNITNTKVFESTGLRGHPLPILLVLLVCVILSSWLFYLIFSWISGLPYSFWVMFNVSWVMIPVFFGISKTYFTNIPSPFFTHWTVGQEGVDTAYWENRDNFKFMLITVKIKRKPNARRAASLSVRLPLETNLGSWFDRFIEDQNVRFPADTIEAKDNGEDISWVFYTNKWFRFPLFMRVLDPNKSSVQNRIKNKRTIYIKRTKLKQNNNG